jgi:hypothetical protein
MPERRGLSLDDDLFAFIEDERIVWEDGEREIRSRSETVNELVRLAKEVREELDRAPFEVEQGVNERRMVQQALRDRIREETEG